MEEFEEQAIANATCKPKIWKGYVDDTFTVSDRDHVNGFLQHLNSQQPTIRFTMEIKKDNTNPSRHNSYKEPRRSSHYHCLQKAHPYWPVPSLWFTPHPQSVKRGIVKCLYDRAKHLTTKPSDISEEKKHLSSVLVSNSYPSSFVRKLAKTTRVTANKEPAKEI